MKRAPIGPSMAVLLVFLGWTGCSEDFEPEFSSLRSPAGFVYAPSCIDNGRWVSFADCPDTGTTNLTGYLINEGNATLAYVDLNTTTPSLLDAKLAVPGLTSVPIGERPSSVAATPDGVFVLTTNTLTQDVSVVLVEAHSEVARLPLDAVATDIFYEAAGDRFWLLYPEGRIEARRFTYDCGQGEGVYMGLASCMTNGVATPTMTFEVVLTLDLGGSPQAFVADPKRARFYVSYRDLLYISGIGLESSGETCLDASASLPCETVRLPGGFSCADGLDNDGDGFADGQDPQCYSPRGAESPDHAGIFQLTPCTDNADNDGDGLRDLFDPGCVSERDGSEEDGLQSIDALNPCVDGVDGGDDGFTDNRDPSCLGPNTPQEARSSYVPSCDDGVDNDGDGAADYPADPDCTGFEDDVEEAGRTACDDGIDNDGDGSIDLRDAGCSSDTDVSELEPRGVCNDGIDNDDDGRTDTADPGCYGAQGLTERQVERVGLGPLGIDPKGRWLYVIDRSEWQVLVVDIEAEALLSVGLRDPRTALPGIAVNPLPMGVVGDIRTTVVADDGAGRLVEREEAVFYAATTRGTLEVGSIHQTFTVSQGDTELDRVELFTLRLADVAGAEVATVTRIECVDVACPEEALPEISLRKRPSIGFTEEGEFITTNDDGQPFSVAADEIFLDETWTLTYEGILPGGLRTDGVVDVVRPGKILGKNANYCSLGARPGDRLTITSAPSDPLGITKGGACDEFFQTADGRSVVLEYEVDAVRPREIYLRLIERDNFAQQLPRRECFPTAISYELRASEEWIIDGDQTESLHARSESPGMCGERINSHIGPDRFRTGDLYRNAFFEFTITDQPSLPIVRDTSFAFTIFSGYLPQRRLIGPMPRAIRLVEALRLIFIPDAGSNRLQIFDADSLLALPSL